MQILGITNKLYNNFSICRLNYNNENRYVKHHSMTLGNDTFAKSARNIAFGSSVIFENNDFEKQFPRSFFRKLAQEGLPCAYTGVRMIPRADVDSLIAMQILNKKSEIAMRYLKPYKDCLYDDSVEQRIYTLLENEAKKHPDLKLQELLKLKYDVAEKSLVRQQAKVLDEIILMSRNLPKSDYKKIRDIAQISFDKILAQDPLPEERFRRKEFIYALRDLDLSNEKIKQAMINKAEKLPQSSNSVNAFIVKYSQPYKFKYNNDGKIVKTARDSEELALRLLRPSIATDEHIYPQKLYRQEEIARQKGDESAMELSDYKVTILTSAYINGLKSDTSIDDFIKKCKYDVKNNIQNHIQKLIELDQSWYKCGHIDDAKRLAEYIQVLKKEFDHRSSIISIDISLLNDFLPDLEKSAQKHEEKMVQKRIKKTGRADNSHKEVYIEHGHMLENRKIQKHTSRFHS